MKTLLHSLRWRLQAWHGLLLLLVIAASILPGYHLARENQMQRIDQELRQLEQLIVRGMMRQLTGAHEGAAPPVLLTPEEFRRRLATQTLVLPADLAGRFESKEPGYAYFAVRDTADRIVLQSDNAPADLQFLPVSAADFNDTNRSVESRREYARTSTLGVKLVVGRDMTPVLAEMQTMAWVHAGVGIGVWLLGLLGGWWLSGRAIRPIRTISETATRIADGNLQERIDPTAMDLELAQLSGVLNDTFERLHVAFERQRQFTADASHELRTPIALLISETQRLLKRDRTPEEYRDALRTCGDTAQRMRRLVEALLVLARQDHQETQTHRQPCDLAAIVRDVVAHLSSMAEERGRRIDVDLQAAPCEGDPEALTMLATNLINNALQHGGNVRVRTQREGTEVRLIVQDDGPGIPTDDLPHIFERFYRADQARTSTAGHSGLGLAIAKAVASNHRGSIQAANAGPGGGACFTVTLSG